MALSFQREEPPANSGRFTAFNATAGRMMTVVLRNQQAGAEYG
jgi:hypothetical protein